MAKVDPSTLLVLLTLSALPVEGTGGVGDWHVDFENRDRNRCLSLAISESERSFVMSVAVVCQMRDSSGNHLKLFR